MLHAARGPRPSAESTRTELWLRSDWLVVAILLVLGLFQIIFVARAPDFTREDVFYADAARSILQHHFYGINGRIETNMPPGLSAFLAILCAARVCGHVGILRAMAVLQTAGFVACYAVLRRVSSRATAAIISVVLLSSPIYFSTATEVLVAYFPYFVVTMSALLVARKLVYSEPETPWLRSTIVLAILCVASVMMATVGVALLGALLVKAFLLYRRSAHERKVARGMLFASLSGVAVQLLWMQRKPAPLEWPIAGYPRPYLQQLLVKSGNNPELGMATFRDVLLRVAQNATDRSAMVGELLSRHWFNAHWASVFIAPTLALILIGWILSIRHGFEVEDWYFAGHEFIYLLWPWSLEYRFFLPVAPLACLYLWRGVTACRDLLHRRPRRLGVGLAAASVLFGLGSAMWIDHPLRDGALPAGRQGTLSFVAWIVLGIVGLVLVWTGSGWRAYVRLSRRSLGSWSRFYPQQLLRPIGYGIVVVMVLLGVVSQIQIARLNLDLHSRVNAVTADAEAGIWLRDHTPPQSVIMARQLPTTLHYSKRHEVWFPPSSNPQLLFEGIQRLNVQYIVVVHRDYSYYLPPDDVSFGRLLSAYPDQFCLVFENTKFRVFALDREMMNVGASAVSQRVHHSRSEISHHG